MSMHLLLVELFLSSEHYQVSSQFKRVDGSSDFAVQFIVRRRRILLKSKLSVRFSSSPPGTAVTIKLRQRFREFVSVTNFLRSQCFWPSVSCLHIWLGH